MASIKWSFAQIPLIFVTALILVYFQGTEMPVLASVNSAEGDAQHFLDQADLTPLASQVIGETISQVSPLAPLVFNQPPPPPDRGAPSGQGRGEAGSRGSLCPTVKTPLTPLVPVYQTKGKKSVWGLTVAEHPTLWFYVPYQLTAELPVEFRLQDENNKYLYTTTLTAETAPGVISVRLPSTVTPLEIGKSYFWSFVVKCDPEDPSANIYVNGWVKRSEPSSLIKQIEAATPKDRALIIYAREGIWHESLTVLAELIRAKPNDTQLKANWNKLLKTAGLEDITEKPIVQCCMTQP